MPAARLSRNDSGQIIDALNDLSVLLENLGVEDGNVVLAADGNIYGTFTVDTNKLDINITDDGKKESVAYAN